MSCIGPPNSTKDFQELNAQGVMTYRVVDPDLLAKRVDFSIDVRTGAYIDQPLERLSLLTQAAHHATHGRAQFFLHSIGQDIEDINRVHREFQAALDVVQRAVPIQWRRTRVDRKALDRFLFGPEDIVVALGQVGRVSNIAKYLDGQVLIGLNPDPGRYDGLMVKNEPAAAHELMLAAAKGGRSRYRQDLPEAGLIAQPPTRLSQKSR